MKCRLKENPVYECIQIDGGIQKLEYEESDHREIYDWYFKNAAAGNKKTNHWGDGRNYARPEMNFKYCNISFEHLYESGKPAVEFVLLALYRKGSEKPSKVILSAPGDVLMVVPTNAKGKKTMTVIGVKKDEWLKKYEVVEDGT